MELRNILIFAGIAAVFIAFSLYCCKRRRDQARANSGSDMARSQRSKLPLTEEDPNRSLLEAQERAKSLVFVESTEPDEEENGEIQAVPPMKDGAEEESVMGEAERRAQELEDLL